MGALFFLPILLLITFGCSTNSAVKARVLEEDLAKYQQGQQAQIDSLNQRYQATYARLVSDLKDAQRDQRALLFDGDTQRIADKLIADWPESNQPTQLHDALEAVVSSQVKRVQAADDELAVQKAAYASTFRTLTAYVKKLDEARQSLRKLAEGQKDRLGEAFQALLGVMLTATKDPSAATNAMGR